MKLNYVKSEMDKREVRKAPSRAAYLVLAGALLAGGCGHVNGPASPQGYIEMKRTKVEKLESATASFAPSSEPYMLSGPIDKTPTSQIQTGCSCKFTAGQEMWTGTTWRSMMRAKIISVDSDKITVDITIPYTFKTSETALMSLTMRLNGVELPCDGIERIASLLEYQKIIMAEEAAKEKPKGQNIDALKQARKTAGSNISKEINDVLRSIDAIAAYVFSFKVKTESLILRQALAGPYKYGMATTDLGLIFKTKVVSSDEREFALEFEGTTEELKQFNGQRLRLDRKIDLRVEYLTENAGFLSVPYRIESLTADKNGGLIPVVKVDCTRNVEMEIFDSEHASGPHPDCQKKK